MLSIYIYLLYIYFRFLLPQIDVDELRSQAVGLMQERCRLPVPDSHAKLNTIDSILQIEHLNTCITFQMSVLFDVIVVL